MDINTITLTSAGGTFRSQTSQAGYEPLEFNTPAQVTLAANVSITVTDVYPNKVFPIKWDANLILDGLVVSICGIDIAQDCLNQPGKFEAINIDDNWSVQYFPDFIVRPQANEKVGTLVIDDAGGTTTLVAGVDADYIRVSGNGDVLLANAVITAATGAKDRSQFTIQIDGNLPLGTSTFTVFNQTIAAVDAQNGGIVIVATYDEGAGDWTSYFVNRTITTNLLPSIAALSMLGNATNATGAVTAITAATDGAVYRRSGNAIVADKLVADNFGATLFPTQLTKVTLSSSAILNAGVTLPKLLDGAGAGKIYPIFKVIAKQNYNSIPYATNLDANIISFAGDDKLFACLGLLDFNDSGVVQFFDWNPGGPSRQYVVNDVIQLGISGGNPTAGDSTIDVYIFHSTLSV